MILLPMYIRPTNSGNELFEHLMLVIDKKKHEIIFQFPLADSLDNINFTYVSIFFFKNRINENMLASLRIIFIFKTTLLT